MRLAIIGSRNLTNIDRNAIIRHIGRDVTDIISGGALGVDRLAKQIAGELGLNYTEHAPDYKAYGRMAPIVRNAEIVRAADRVLAVWDHSSRGTAHVIALCIENRVPVRVLGPADVCLV